MIKTINSAPLTLNTPVAKVNLIGPASARRLEKLNIRTVRDLLYHLPSRYEDFSLITKINAAQAGETVTIQGRLISIKNAFTRGGFVLQRGIIKDDTGTIDILWFNQRFLPRMLHQNDHLSLSGKIKQSGHHLELESPVYEIIPASGQTIHTGRLVPIYPETAGVSSKWLRSRIHFLLSQIQNGELVVSEGLDKKILDEYALPTMIKALVDVHFPKSLDSANEARRRLAFEELLYSQLLAQKRRHAWAHKTVGHKFQIVGIRDKLTQFVDNLPFTLTGAQKSVINQIYKDLAGENPMNRLLQGDVGSGKTVVAALAMLASYLNNFQAVLMAPTDILAQQHFQTLTQLLSPLNIKVGIATGSHKDYKNLDIVVGTHALLSDRVAFNRLGLIVIDEQHRFGVEQRAKLSAKGINPHILTMTATPIPRTVALTLYGDLELSVLTEMPKNRLPVKTWVVPNIKRTDAYNWIRKQNTQTFILCPLIEESEVETMQEVKAAKKEYDFLHKEIFPDLKMGLIHGKLTAKEKSAVLEDFRKAHTNILVATPVVEVGIDIPSATIMLIEGADRFGLAQLHQLRGRVGRGDRQSYCLLFSENDSPTAINRLKNLETLNNGLALAEADLKFRGPGQRFGTAQHGRWDLKIADFSDLNLIESTHRLAQKVTADPQAFPTLQERIAKSTIEVASN